MLHQFNISILVALGLTLIAHAQDKLLPVQIRAVLHDPMHPTADLYYADSKGNIVPLNFRPKALTAPLLTMPLKDSLVLYDKAEVDPDNPNASMAASIKWPSNVKRAIVIVLPSLTGEKPAYRMLLIDDSEKSFPKGESRVLPLISVDVAIEAGEHKLPVKLGKITRVPPVTKVNDFNMAQTNFYYKRGNSWLAFTERQLQYIEACRRLFIVDAPPGALSPRVTTIVDITP